MTFNENRMTAATGYMKQMKKSRACSIIMLVLQLAMLIAILLFVDRSVMTACIIMAVLRVGKRVGLWNRTQTYLVTEYDRGGREIDRYETSGTFIGGMLKLLGGALIGLSLGHNFLVKYFPADIPGFEFAITVVAFWIMATPMIDEVLNIVNANKFLAGVYNTDKPVAELLEETDVRSDAVKQFFAVLMGTIVVIAIIAQFLGLWFGGTAHKKQFADAAYDAYVEYQHKNPECPDLDENWFENALEGHDVFEKFNSETTLEGAEAVQKGERTFELVSQLEFAYYDKAWHVEQAQQWNGDVLSVNISGTWTGVGNDFYLFYNSGDIQSSITLESMDEEQAVGSISGTFRGETIYYCSFTAQVQQESGLLIVSGVSNEEIGGFYSSVDIYFVYDPNTDVITNADHAPAIVFERS